MATANPSAKPEVSASKKIAKKEHVLLILKQMVSEAIYLDLSKIDTDKSFQELGMDSIIGVELIKKINEHFKLKFEVFLILIISFPKTLKTLIEIGCRP